MMKETSRDIMGELGLVRNKFHSVAFVVIVGFIGIHSVSANQVDELSPGEWLEVPDSKLRALDPDVLELFGYDRDFENIITAWNGGAYDSKRDRLVIWGGGHNDYPGNGIYTFDSNSLNWLQEKAPSSFEGWNSESKFTTFPSDGNPVSRHTYDYLEYLPPPIDRFFSAGGGALWQTSFFDSNSYLYDFDSKSWSVSFAVVPNADVAAISGYDPIEKKVWLHGSIGTGNFLSSYDAVSATWKAHGQSGIEPGGNASIALQWTGAVDPVRRKFVAIGNIGRTQKPMPAGAIYVWDINNEGFDSYHLKITSGDTEILETENPGFVYDPVSDKFVAWSGTTAEADEFDGKLDPSPFIDPSSVYVLDMDTAVWTRISPSASNSVTPTAATAQGTYGRFRYVPSKNVFVLVNSVDENVFFYKLTENPTRTVPVSPGKISGTVNILP